ncbi:MAG: hypothetical protein A2Y14_04780 [Verrucomicrobia bacterium GWF2_51_19]|nr:MAG: hypothetical protein A2Y14_04780 [Verrucomicrobia bacterium GWF2_51_19]
MQQYNKYNLQAESGQKLTYPSDDPVAVGRVFTLRAEKSTIAQYNRNGDNVKTILDTTYASLKQLQELKTCVDSLAIDTSSELGLSKFSISSVQVNQFIEQAFTLLNSKFSGKYLFGGVTVSAEPFVATRDSYNNITAVTYRGTPSTVSVAMSVYVAENTSIRPFTSGLVNENLRDFVNHLIDLRTALNNRSAPDVRTQINVLKDDENNLLSAQGLVTGNMTRLDIATTQNSSRFIALGDQISRDADTNFDEVAIQVSNAMRAYQIAIQSGAKIMSVSVLDYL